MEEGQGSDSWPGYVDWRNKPAKRSVHGGISAAAFVLVVEVLENLAFLANASNLVLYLVRFMHFSPSKAANAVTNFMGTAFLLALLGGFLSDAFFTTYLIYLISALIEFLGLVLLTIQAHLPHLRPTSCDPSLEPCLEPTGSKEAILFLGLYLVALGVGGIKGSLPSHGAEQFDPSTPRGRKQRSSFFNYYVFSLSCGGLIAVTFVVWLEDNEGWEWGFGVSSASMLLSIVVFLVGSTLYRNKVPDGSPLTTMAKVILASICKGNGSKTASNAIVSVATSPRESEKAINEEMKTKMSSSIETSTSLTGELKFLNRAAAASPSGHNQSLVCTVQEVEEVKLVIKILPIFACTIILNCCLAQLSTFSVQQAATMDTKIGKLKVPPASLPVFPVVFIMILVPLYDRFFVPLASRITGIETGVSHLQRIGAGLVLSIVAMATAALVETKRKHSWARVGHPEPGNPPLPDTFLWIAFQYLFLGSADVFTLAGLLEFFFTEAPMSMRSLATSLSWASLALGYYLSSVLVTIVNKATSKHGHAPWLSGRTLNDFHLERFYWLMCVLSALNFVHYLFWAARYRYRSQKTHNSSDVPTQE
ncbi:protein NRT1/ PTR FAMILY 4.6 [Amborella trichopoda]|uniref:Major facilitator superfamily (MFS) profile domain-containing protein n=1 Tax=Amborella trichopoda TaxID=13333 RepID=W1P7Y3_AMBTC|nr:protein NRT1/ PTR FAMILY 4.6 [Amborella trichopoda]ERN03774.1 hypothetical protein AMTR_s00078p00081800 [Amborella trichopoda]|eukprot:XP_006842099.1 protein NRT1/ PTR FAMILY 4.6 [Amborella trichopoda]